LCFVAVGATTAATGAWQEKTQDDGPKPIGEIMEKAMKGGLAKKVASGKAEDKEKLELLNMLIDLVDQDPPKGDPMQWKMMAGKAMMDAAKVVVGREGAGEQLTQAINCKNCHDVFKP
jgi:hypothetical protein